MAYSSTVTITRKGNFYRVLIDETGCESTSEATIELGIQTGTVVATATDFTSGDGANCTSKLTTVTDGNFGTEEVCVGLRTSVGNASRVSGSGDGTGAELLWPRAFYSSDGKLYHRARPASGTNNVIKTEYLIKAGW